MLFNDIGGLDPSSKDNSQQLWEPMAEPGRPTHAGERAGPSHAELDVLLGLTRAHGAPNTPGVIDTTIYRAPASPHPDRNFSESVDDELARLLDEMDLEDTQQRTKTPRSPGDSGASPGRPNPLGAQDTSATPGRPRMPDAAQATGTGALPFGSLPLERQLDAILHEDPRLNASWKEFTTSTGIAKTNAGMEFMLKSLSYLLEVMDAQQQKAASTLRKLQDGQPDRSLGNHLRRKEKAYDRGNAREAVTLHPSMPFMSHRQQLRAQMEPALAHVLAQLHGSNQAEQAEELNQLWASALPMLTNNDPAIILAAAGQGQKLHDFLKASLVKGSMPSALKPPPYISQPGVPHQLSAPSQRHSRCLSNLRWIGQAIETARDSVEGRRWTVRGPQDVKDSCVPLLKSARRVLQDTATHMQKLYPGVVFDTRKQQQQLNDSIGVLQNADARPLGAPPLSIEESNEAVGRMHAAFRGGMNAVVELHNHFVVKTDQLGAPHVQESDPEEVVDTEPETGAGLSFGLSEEIPYDGSPATGGEGPGLAPPSGSLATPQAAAAATDRIRAADRRSAVTTVSTAQAPAAPNFQYTKLADVTRRLDEMAAEGQAADTLMLGHIADRMMSEMHHLAEPDRQALLYSLLPHLRDCTSRGCAVSFPAIQSFLRAAGASASWVLRKDFRAAAAQNFLVKDEEAREVNAFKKFALNGGASEMLLQLRGTYVKHRDAALGKMLRYFQHARPGIKQAAFTAAMERRNTAPLSTQSKLQASLSRVLAGLADLAPENKDVREIAQIAALMHGRPLPSELLESTSFEGWKNHALATFMDSRELFGTYTDQGTLASQVYINVHDTGRIMLFWLLHRHLSRPDERRGLKIIVGGEGHPSLHEKTLRSLIDEVLRKHPGWTAARSGSTSVIVSRRDPAAQSRTT